MTVSTRRQAKRALRRQARRALPLWRRLLPTWRVVLGAVVTLLMTAAAAFAVLYVIVPVPDPNAHAVAQNNIYLYSDATTEIARTGAVNRTDVAIDKIPLDTQHAVVSAEDRTFYQNRGIDLKGMLRAGWNTLTGKGTQGGSTITQQYVKNYYLTQDQTIARKGRELFIALKVDQQRDKNEILAGYLNSSYFGRGAYGIQSAAHAYYGVDVSELTLAQGAYLAALLQAPSSYDVKTAKPANRDKAIARWNYTLDGMVQLGFLDAADRAAETFPEPVDPQPTTGLSGQAGYLVGVADDYLTSAGIIDAATLKAGGWRITTTFDKPKQDAFTKAVQQELTDELDPKARPTTDTDVRVAGASVEPATGRVVAVYGGPDYAKQPYNDALRQDNQIGSTFKPIDLAAGLVAQHTPDGRPITTETRYDGTSERHVTGGPTPYAPPNEDDIDYGNITLRYAMVKSVNSVYAQEGVDAGLARVRDTAVKLGIPDNVPGMDPANTSMTLGTATPSALDLAGVYAALANHGRARTPWSVLKLERLGTGSGSGSVDVPKMPDHAATDALDRQIADTVTDVLRDVVSTRGTGAAALDLGRPAAGKTGTTDSNLSAWFAGFTPQLTTTVGLFRENPKTHAKEPLAGTAGLTRINGGTFPTKIWTAYMTDALDGTEVKHFDLQTGRGNGGGQNNWPTGSASTSAAPSAGVTPTPGATPPGTAPSPAPTATAPAPARPTATGGEPTPGPAAPSPQAPAPTPTQEQPSATPRPSQTHQPKPTPPVSASAPPTGAATQPAAP
ncbi:transglycosylase domain-containing protein [Streptomyces sp. SP17BM10]|uniref:transglycosylase domain-containing protein n=1 Tax=Streptomyces sp. SP17BM10 TaxID=3002530 RepID=UPI002E78F161|nr:transglycosylase domain-containing protein [Streptomyces sp. SP17BM10]MEE1785921.1 transglycosylase domain-containing protein [Streptomyces sp. SP17BM10]